MVHVNFNLNHLFNFSSHDGSQIILCSHFVLFRAIHKCSNVPSANEFTLMIQKKVLVGNPESASLELLHLLSFFDEPRFQ